MRDRKIYSEMLDGLGIGFAEYDADLRAVMWNSTFLSLFPEQRRNIHVGEHYSENLRRFYQTRVDGEDLTYIDRLISEGIQRHLTQTSPFEFTHHGLRIRVNSALVSDGGRVRIWKPLDVRSTDSDAQPLAFDSLERISEGACILDGKNLILVANRRFRELYGIPASDPIVGQRFEDVVSQCWPSGRAFADMRAAIRNGLRYDDAPFEVELPGDRWTRVTTRHTDREHAYLVHSDITANRRTERELARLAAVDPLTGLANRRALDEFLSSAGQSVTFIVIDADHFKRLNDAYGHAAGDACLKRIAEIIQPYAEKLGGLAVRLGGEEFAVVFNDARLDALHICETISNRISASGAPVVTVSIGVAVGSPSLAREQADQALYEAKRNGRNCVVRFSPAKSA